MRASLKWIARLAGAVLAVSVVVSSAPAQAASAPDGAALYRENCRSCHGAKGLPPARMLALYPTLKVLADSAAQARLSADSIVAVLRHGKGKNMRSFVDRLSPAEMLAVATFVKTFWSPATARP